MITVKAQLNGLRIAPRKVRLVAGLIRRKPVVRAINQLEILAKKPADTLIKLVNSAVSNATSRYDVAIEDLFISEITVDEGMKLKRFRPKGFGRVSPLEKKTSRITIILTSKKGSVKSGAGSAKADTKEVQTVKSVKKERRSARVGEAKVAKPQVSAAKKLFQRKSI